MILSLVVKGDRFQAAQSAAERGIPFAFVRELSRWNETVGRVPVSFRLGVMRWFGESNGAAPFPAGTLLHFSEISESEIR